MVISSPDHIELRKVMIEGAETSGHVVRFVFEGVGEHRLNAGEVLLLARAQVVAVNWGAGYRRYEVSLIPHNTATILVRFYDYLMDEIRETADEILDVHHALEKVI